jgi:uncharacterized protein YdhG (YjbR/CyaY superfamily)
MTNDEYISGQSDDLQPTLRQMREAIRAAAPKAAERFSYNMPSFYLGKTFLCGFCVFKRHIGFYPGGEPIGVFADRLKGYKTSKGAVQFPLGQPVDYGLITDMVRWRVENHK